MSEQHTPGCNYRARERESGLWLVGFTNPDKEWETESVHASQVSAEKRVSLLNHAPALLAERDKLKAEKAELLEALKLAGIIIQGEWLNLGDAINRARNKNTRDQLQGTRDALNRIRIKVNAAIAKAEPRS